MLYLIWLAVPLHSLSPSSQPQHLAAEWLAVLWSKQQRKPRKRCSSQEVQEGDRPGGTSGPVSRRVAAPGTLKASVNLDSCTL